MSRGGFLGGEVMSFLHSWRKKVRNQLGRDLRHLGLKKKTAKRIARNLDNPSHLLSRGYQSVVKSLSKQANKMARKMATSNVSNTSQTASQQLNVADRLNYQYRRLSDIT